MSDTAKTLVGIMMGSKTDLEYMSPGGELLAELGIGYEVRILSAHRTPDAVAEYAEVKHANHSNYQHERDADRNFRRGPIGRAFFKEHDHDEPQIIISRDGAVDHREDNQNGQQRASGLDRGAKDQYFAHKSGGQRQPEQAQHKERK